MTSPLAAALKGASRQYELDTAAEEEREAELTAAERYARDPFLLADEGHVWIWSKFERRAVRLRLYETQRELIVAWVDTEHLAKTGQLRYRNVVDEKSRQMGETWALAFAICWALHFHTVNLFAHHVRAAEIDDGGMRNTWRSLFGKVRYMDARLGATRGLPDPSARASVPGLGRPLLFRPRSDTPARIESPSTGAICYGGEQSTDPGRGGTFDGVAIDETSFVPWGEKVHAALDDACPEGKLYLSTPNGDDNVHARLADERPAGWAYLRHHWSQHPVYSVGLHIAATPPGEPDPRQPSKAMREAARACELCEGTRQGLRWDAQDPLAHRYPGRLASPWYDKAIISKTDEQVAQELDIDRERALGGRVYGEFQTSLHVVEAGIPFDPLLPVELAFDYGLDVTAVPVIQNAPQDVRVIGLLERGDAFKTVATPEQVAEALRAYLIALGVPQELVSPYWTRQLRAVGDPSGENRDLRTGLPWIEAYRLQGFHPMPPPGHLTRTVEPSIASVKRLLLGTPKPLRVCGVNAQAMATRLRNNTWPTDKLGRRRKGSTKPDDDVHNHACRALAYWAVATFPPPLQFDPLEEFEPPDDERADRGAFAGMEPGMTL